MKRKKYSEKYSNHYLILKRTKLLFIHNRTANLFKKFASCLFFSQNHIFVEKKNLFIIKMPIITKNKKYKNFFQ